MRLTQTTVAPRLLSLITAIEPQRKWNSSGDLGTHEQIKARLFSLQDQICAFCERPITIAQSSVEHLHPKQTPGCAHTGATYPHYEWSNLVLTCLTNSTCNGVKADAHLCAEFDQIASHQDWLRVDPLTGDLSPNKALGVDAAKAARLLISSLNLNAPDLSTRRRDLREAAVSKLVDENLSDSQVKFEPE